MYKIGDWVKLKDLDEYRYGRGGVPIGAYGQVIDVTAYDANPIVNFHGHHDNWQGLDHELVPVDPPDEINDDGVDESSPRGIAFSELVGGERYYTTDFWYKYNGHGGYQHPEDGWKKGVTCYSTICQDNTKTLVKVAKPRVVTPKEFRRMVRVVNKVSAGVRRVNKEHPPSFEEATMMFNSGSGYADYLAFCLFRMFYRTPHV